MQILFSVRVERQPMEQLLSSDHFTVDGTLIDAWASHKSFQPTRDSDDKNKPGSSGA